VWKNSLKNIESDDNKILYETLLDFLLRNGVYFLTKPRSNTVIYIVPLYRVIEKLLCNSQKWCTG
jgi:hypothetical protein